MHLHPEHDVPPTRSDKGAATLDRGASRRALTPREAEIVALVTEGYTNRQIAQHFGLSIATEKRHISNIMIKWRCANRAHMAAKAAVRLHAVQESLRSAS